MKSVIYTILSLSLLLLLSACSKEGFEPLNSDEEISLRASVDEPGRIEVGDTRASVDYWQMTPLSFGVLRTVSIDPAVIEHWNAVVTLHGQVIFSPIKTYSESTAYLMRGYNPRATSIESTNPKLVNFTLNGTQDLMVSDLIDPGTLEAKKEVTAIFEHRLTQFSITIDNNLSDPYPVKKITKIYFEGIGSPLADKAQLNFETGNVTFGSTGAIMYAYNESIGPGINLIPGIQDGVAKAMFQPGKQVRMYIEYDGKQQNFLIANPTAPLIGTSYKITLSFKSAGLYATSITLTNWIGAPSPSPITIR